MIPGAAISGRLARNAIRFTKPMSTISALPSPWRVTLDTNPDDCNYSCTMCEQHSVYSDKQKERVSLGIRKRRMEPIVFEEVIDRLAAQGLKEVIPSTMGEPLMYSHFDRLVEAVRRQPGLRVNLTTNGSFFPGPEGRSVEDWAKLLLPVISDVKISWNGASAATQEAIMRGSKFDKQLSNLKTWIRKRDELAAAGGNRASVTLQLTFMSTNIAEIPKIVQLGIDNNVDRIKGHHLWAHFKEIKRHDLRSSHASIIAWNDCVTECRQIAANTLLPSGKQIKLEHFELLAVPTATATPPAGGTTRAADLKPPAIPEEAECPFLGKEAWVNHAGDFAPCCAPDEQRRSLGSFGNVRQPGGLLAIWKSDAYRDLVQNYKQKPLCKTCHMRKMP